MSSAHVRHPAYAWINWILFVAIVVAGVTSAAGMVCILRSGRGNVYEAFAEFLVAFVLAAEGAYAWVHFYQDKAKDRVKLLSSLYAEFDTATARRAREAIYQASPSELCVKFLHDPNNKEKREQVESTIASLDRLGYYILNLGVESEDAFQLWSGVVFQVCYRVWPYIEEQRKERANRGFAHHLFYRRYLEEVVRKWAPRYAKEIRRNKQVDMPSTEEMLKSIFPVCPSSTAGSP